MPASASPFAFLQLFGIDGKLLLAQLVNFGIIVFVLTRWVYHPLLNAMDEREREIEAGRQAAAAAQRERERAEAKAKTIEQKARAEAKAFVDKAKQDAKKTRAEATRTTKAELERLRKDALGRLEAERAAETQAFRKGAVDLVMEATKSVARQTLDEDSHRALIREAIDSLEKSS